MSQSFKFSGEESPQNNEPMELSWLDRPLSGLSSVLGWLLALAIFVGMTTLFGGVTQLDSILSTYSSWFIAHGNVSCAYPPGSSIGIAVTAPLYTLVAGGLSFVFGVGHGAAFPTQAALGSHCLTWLAPIRHWSSNTHALTATLRFGYVGWLALMIGVIAVIRSSGRGRTGWEPLTLVIIACTPPVFMCLQYLFHPQDLLSMGLLLCGVASFQRQRWTLAGIMLGLAFTAQQFAILVLVALLILASNSGRLKLAFGATVTWMVISLPLIVATSGRAFRATLVGSGLGGSEINSISWNLHITSSAAVDLWRIMPILSTAILAIWAKRRLGQAAFGPVPLMALVATALSMRLIFDEGLYGYYFMAVCVALILLDVLRREFRIELIAWIALIVLVFDPLPWGYDPLLRNVQLWIWQLLLVTPAVWLSFSPLLGAIRGFPSKQLLQAVQQ